MKSDGTIPINESSHSHDYRVLSVNGGLDRSYNIWLSCRPCRWSQKVPVQDLVLYSREGYQLSLSIRIEQLKREHEGS